MIINETPTILEVDAMANLHSHLRESDEPEVMAALIKEVINGGVDVVGPMPNTKIPLTTVDRVMNYIRRAKELVPSGENLRFLPIAQITEDTTVVEMVTLVEYGIIDFKIYPRFRTTKSEHGVVRYWRIIRLIQEAAHEIYERFKIFIRIHLHPEHPSMEFFNQDAEFLFLPIAYMLVEETDAVIIWEHGTDARCIRHWKKLAGSGRFCLTLTAHHLVTNSDRTFGDVRSTCKPPIKNESDREQLVELVCEGHDWVMAAADDAPHPDNLKHVHEGTCACGAYTAPFLVPLYAHALMDGLIHGSAYLRVFNGFISSNARKLYGLPAATRKVRLVRKMWRIPMTYQLGTWVVEPFWANQEICWTFVS